MKLGTETASLINHLESRATIGAPTPAVGMGATLLGWTDRHAATVVKVIELASKRWSHEVHVQRDIARRTDDNGMSESQGYEFSPNPDGYVTIFRRERATGAYVQHVYRGLGNPRLYVSKGEGLIVGRRDEYFDYSF